MRGRPTIKSLHPTEDRPRTVWTPLFWSLLVVLFIATFGSFSAAFGIGSTCTNEYSCTVDTCRPCRTAVEWLLTGWAAQGILLIAGLMLALLGALRIMQRTFRISALLLGPASIGLFIFTTSLALRSF